MMTKTEIKEARQRVKRWLASYRHMKDEREWIKDKIQSVYSPGSPSWDGMPRGGGGGDPMLLKIEQLDKLRHRYSVQERKLAEQLLAIEEALECLDFVERKLMRLRYIDGLRWEDVCEKMCYSWMQTHNIHSRALDKLVRRLEV